MSSIQIVITGSSIDIDSSYLHESPQKISAKVKALPRSKARTIHGGRSDIARKNRIVRDELHTYEEGGKKKSFHLQEKNEM